MIIGTQGNNEGGGGGGKIKEKRGPILPGGGVLKNSRAGEGPGSEDFSTPTPRWIRD